MLPTKRNRSEVHLEPLEAKERLLPMKRKAPAPLERETPDLSPAEKRARTGKSRDLPVTLSAPKPGRFSEDGSTENEEHVNGDSGLNGDEMRVRPGEQDNVDLAGADAILHEELEEAHATPQALEDDEDEEYRPNKRRAKEPEKGYEGLYLDTIDRQRLDFDFEKQCSVTLSTQNIYACLTCGKYLQGRGDQTQAYFHSVNADHHPFINLQTKKIYILPDGYEVHDKTFDDIKYVVDPYYTKEEVARLDSTKTDSFDAWNKKYTAGFVGLNNIKANSYVNVVIHALAHVKPLRNFFLLQDVSNRPRLAQDFSALVRKTWNFRAFKAHVSPHELLQSVSLESKKKFVLTQESDPAEFLMWFLTSLHTALGGKPNVNGSSIIHRIFQGNLHSESQKITARANAGDRLIFEDAPTQITNQKFLILPLELPPKPLFASDVDENAIPSVTIEDVLEKYNGIKTQEKVNTRFRYRLVHPLPPYIILTMKRFQKGNSDLHSWPC